MELSSIDYRPLNIDQTDDKYVDPFIRTFSNLD